MVKFYRNKVFFDVWTNALIQGILLYVICAAITYLVTTIGGSELVGGELVVTFDNWAVIFAPFFFIASLIMQVAPTMVYFALFFSYRTVFSSTTKRMDIIPMSNKRKMINIFVRVGVCYVIYLITSLVFAYGIFGMDGIRNFTTILTDDSKMTFVTQLVLLFVVFVVMIADMDSKNKGLSKGSTSFWNWLCGISAFFIMGIVIMAIFLVFSEQGYIIPISISLGILSVLIVIQIGYILKNINGLKVN